VATSAWAEDNTSAINIPDALSTAPSILAPASPPAGTYVIAQAGQNAAVVQNPVVASEIVPEQVLVTGSLIHGVAAVGAPVTSLGAQDFRETGSLTVSDVLRTDPSVVVLASSSITNGGGNVERGTPVDIHGLSTKSPRSLMLIDGMRFPAQGQNACGYDPSIIPELSLDRIDVLADGASATYGSDAIAGVINVVLKRGYDGAVTQFRVGSAAGGDFTTQASQLFGRTWDGGDVTVSYEWYNATAIPASKRSGFTYNYTPWGLDNRTPVASSVPGTVSTGAPSSSTGTTCTNCYAIPAGQNGVGLTWATLLADKGVTNELNPYLNADATAAQQRNAATLTFDQRVFDGVSFFAEGFYSNRRSQIVYPPTITSAAHNEFSVTVPTTNPYYPVGAPSGLRVNYNLSYELPPTTSAYEISERFAAGFDLDLPFLWKGKLTYSTNEEKNDANAYNAVNTNDVSAALGATIAAVAGSGSNPGVASFTKPANIPYLNLFCDPRAFACNSPATLNFIAGYNLTNTTYLVQEYAANFDGPLFAIPGGDVRGAIGSNYVVHNYLSINQQNYNATANAVPSNTVDPEGRKVWAIFGQLNIPLFGAENALPMLQKVDVEFSARYDHYSDFGGTTNPKVSINWTPVDQLILRGTWGTSFRAPAFSEISANSGVTVQPLNIAAGASSNSTAACQSTGGTPVAGSIAAILNPTCSAALQYPGGIAVGGGSGGAAFLRGGNGTLLPEKATNYSFGAEYAPTNFFSGLDLQVTYYHIVIDNLIQQFQLTTGTGLNDPTLAFVVILPSNPNFQSYVNQLLHSPFSQVNPALATNIAFINDSSARNDGSQLVDGIDFAASYDWDAGQFGAWNAGITGSYFLRNNTSYVAGATPVDLFDVGGQAQGVRFRYRARLGWAEDGWSLAGFVNYQSHYYSTQPFPPAAFLAGFPNYSDLQPSFYTFDVSAGYNLGNQPANDYLKNIGVQFVVTDVTNKLPPFMYRVATTGGNPAAFDISLSPVGRVLTLIVSKTW
jgi:iron complex outermembrane receptor protein